MSVILYIGGFELPDKNAAAHRVISNAKILRDLGYHVVFADYDAESNDRLSEKESCFGFERWSLGRSVNRLTDISPITEIIEKYREEISAVIAYNYPSVALARLKKYLNRNNIKIIADVTEWYGIQGSNPIHRLAKGIDSFYRMRVVQPNLDGVIAISRFLEKYYQKYLPTVFLPPLVDIEDKKWKVEAEKINDGRIHIFYAGTGGKHKDKLNLLIQSIAAGLDNKICFHVAGLTKDKYLKLYPEHEKILERVGDAVIFRGRIPHTDVIKELKSCHFSMFYREVTRVTTAGFSTKFAESISAGVPVLTNHTGDLKEYLIEGENGFWIDDINKGLLRISKSDIQNLCKMSDNFDKTVFDYRAYTVCTDRFIKEVLGK